MMPVQPKDIIGLFPKVKHIEIYNKDCKAYIQSGKIQLNS